MTKDELNQLVGAEVEKLGVGSPEFLRRHNDLMTEMEQIQQREQARRRNLWII